MSATRLYPLLGRMFLTGVGFLFLLGAPTHAQYTLDYQTNTISGVTSNWAGSYIVGSNTFADVLLIESSGVLSSANDYLGYEEGGSNNSVLVTGAGSVWTNSNELNIGRAGAGNTLVISNGGQAFDNFGYIGHAATSGRNNVFVGGSGSSWISYWGFAVGCSGSGNGLEIQDSGLVYSGAAMIGSNASAVGNSVVVSDTGSVWNTYGFPGLTVGESGGGNTLVISNGAAVFNSSNVGASPIVYVGNNSNSLNNSVLVTDPGSYFKSGWLRIGVSGSGNSLIISNGGYVFSQPEQIAFNSDSRNNRVLVSGTGSTWSNRSTLYFGYSGSGNRMVIDHGGTVINSTAYIGYNYAETLYGDVNNVLVTDPGSTWRINGNLYVGYATIGDSLVISNAGRVVNLNGYVGYYGYSSVDVTDGGIWQNNGLYVGAYYTPYGPLLQLDGGSVIVTNGTHDAVFDVEGGSVILNSGTLQVDRFVMTNQYPRFVRTGGTLVYGTAVLDPKRDDDGDGMPNGWEQAHGLDPLNAADASIDSDGDGSGNLQEYLAGTDLTNSLCVFRITGIERDGDDIQVVWKAPAGSTNVVQMSMSVDGEYSNISPAMVTMGSGLVTTNFVDAGGAADASARFYRVRLDPGCSSPVAPGNLTASTGWADVIVLSWTDNSTNEDSFRIERAPDNGGNPGSWTLIATVGSSVTSWIDAAQFPDSTWWYRVRAQSGACDSPYSNLAHATRPGRPPMPPTLTALAVSSHQVNLSWVSSSGNEDGFKIWRSSAGHPGELIATVAGNVTTYADTGRQAHATYWYRVQAYNEMGDSWSSNPASATTTGFLPTPSNLSASVVSSNQVNLSWSDNSDDEEGFKIERAHAFPFDLNGGQIATVISNVTNYSDMGVEPGKQYWYRVRSYSSSWTSEYSDLAHVTVPALPSAPASLAATAVSTNQINLSWTDTSDNEDGFKIERALDETGVPGTWQQIAIVNPNVNNYSDPGLVPTTRYWYRVRAYNVSGDSPYSNTANASTAEGQNVWINPSSDEWEIAPNWSQGVPSSSQAAVLISNANTKTVTIDAATVASNGLNGCLAVGSLTILAPPGSTNTLNMIDSGTQFPLHVVNSLIITNGGAVSIANAGLQVDGTFGIDGSVALLPGAQVTAPNGFTCIGSVGTGQVVMSGGIATLNRLIVGSNTYSAGTLTMTGGSLAALRADFGLGTNSSASVWLSGGELGATNPALATLYIGRFGSAQMTVSNGATLRSSYTQLANGRSSVGTLTVAGGSVDAGTLGVGAGTFSDTTGAVWMSGGQLLAANGGIGIGGSGGVGQMTISNGAVSVGNLGGGYGLSVRSGTLTMLGGTLSTSPGTDYWGVGYSSGKSGSVWINDGAVTATNGNGFLFIGLSGAGQWTMSNGMVAVNNLYEGFYGGAGTLTIAGGSFSVVSNTTIGYGFTGTVWVTGGQLLAPNGLFVLGDYGHGSLTMSGGVMVARSMRISSNNVANTSALSTPGGQVLVFDSLVVGDCISNAIGQITVNGGELYVTNATHTGSFDIRDGTLTISSGTVAVDRFVMTNSCAQFVRTGGTFIYGTAVLTPTRDDDGDGMLNGWEQVYGLDPLNFADANTDPDGDGFTNLQEFQASSDPTNSASSFRITSLVATDDDVLITWMMGSGRTNALQAAAGDDGGGFTNAFADIFTVTNTVGNQTNYLDIGAATNVPSRFYRVRLVP